VFDAVFLTRKPKHCWVGIFPPDTLQLLPPLRTRTNSGIIPAAATKNKIPKQKNLQWN